MVQTLFLRWSASKDAPERRRLISAIAGKLHEQPDENKRFMSQIAQLETDEANRRLARSIIGKKEKTSQSGLFAGLEQKLQLF